MYLSLPIILFTFHQFSYYAFTVHGIVVETIHEQNFVAPSPDVQATTLLLTIEPADTGLPVHYHAGPVIAYVADGEFLWQVNDEHPQIISAGSMYYQKDRSNHVWSANASNTTTCKVIAVVYGRMGENVMTFVHGYKRESYSEALLRARSTFVKH